MVKKLFIIGIVIAVNSCFVFTQAESVDDIGLDMYNFMLGELRRDVEKKEAEKRKIEEEKKIREAEKKINECEISLREAIGLTSLYLKDCIKKGIPCNLSKGDLVIGFYRYQPVTVNINNLLDEFRYQVSRTKR